jgi:succinoglycan biosynthesis transport protein ExoP
LNAPKRQQELEALLPDYTAARTQYQTLLEKYETAQLADPRTEGDRLRVMEPAVPRDQPIGPNVIRLLAVGTALSLGALVGSVFLIERMDTSFHSLEELRAFTRLPVLASLPRIVTAEERSRSRRKDLRMAALTLLLAAVILMGSAYYASGNESLVWRIVHRKG